MMPKNNWTKTDVANLMRYNQHGYRIMCEGGVVNISITGGLDSEAFDLWCSGDWTADREDYVMEFGYPTFTWSDDGYGLVRYLDDFSKEAFTVERVDKVDWMNP